MARQLSGYSTYGAMCYRGHFPPKSVRMPDGTIIDATPALGCTYTRDTWPPRGRGRGESLTSDRRISAKLRAMRVIELRSQGYTWAAIARALGFKDKSGPWRAMRRACDRMDYERFKKQQLQEKHG